MYDEDEDPTDETGEPAAPQDSSASFSVKANIPVGALGGLSVPGVDLLKMNQQNYDAASKRLDAAYDTYAQALRSRRVGPSKSEMLFGALAAFAKPNRTFGGALTQSGGYMADTQARTREATLAREDAIDKAVFDKQLAQMQLAEKYGISGLSLAAKMAGKGGVAYKFFVAPADKTHDARIIRVRADGSEAVFMPPGALPAGVDPTKLPTYTGALPPDNAGGAGGTGGDTGGQSLGAPPPAPPGAAATPDANSIAPSRDKAAVGQPYRAQDGTVMLRAREGAVDEKIADAPTEPASREEALRAGFSRAQKKAGQIIGADSDRLPTPETIAENNVKIAGQIRSAQVLQNEFKALQKRATGYTTGPMGAITKFVPGTPAFDFKTNLQSAVNKIALEELKTMKALSPQGASGFGALSEKELALLENAIKGVNQAQSMKSLMENYQGVIEHYNKLIDGLKKAGMTDEKLRREMIRLQPGAESAAAPAHDPADPLGLLKKGR